MAYSAPELLLVGAAQNLVLLTSIPVVQAKDGFECSDLPFPLDVDGTDPLEYNTPSTW